MNITVTCRCTREMRQEPGRRAGYLMCSCGNRIRLDDHQWNRCHGRDRDLNVCRNPVVIDAPVALCFRHAAELAACEQFTTGNLAERNGQAWLKRSLGDEDETQQVREMKRRRWNHEKEVRKAKLETQSVVYYIALRGCIKIGTTVNMQARMNQLMPDAVLATEPGGVKVEKQRHRQFKHLRAPIGREYFSDHPDLRLHIEKLLAEHGEPAKTGYLKYEEWHLGERMLVDAKTAARLAGVPLRTMYEWIKDERLTVTRPEGRTRGMRVNALEAQELAGLRRAGRLSRLDQAA